ncbi:MAG: bifunctional UDP-N-acetylglucosamine diphosphorylase/glucosamine-1-phosphate N-acetyltransferase GlmU [Desulfovibrionaceae bacterium]|nr:bifunctional UDP-N-acetylglucosamine diphosphorylase/glucosamine-1-phosphate N-acetyltransferase GlmU [Desulfovibrionaceae bacterium]
MGRQAALVLAAGKGTRMHSQRPKVLQTVLGEPMVAHVLAALEPLFGEDVWLVIGHGADQVRKAVPNGRFVLQEEQLGTGHALACALPALREAGVDRLLVLNGDTPLVTAEVIGRFMQEAGSADLAFATITLADAGSYGRVVRIDGQLAGIVEAKDYDIEKWGAVSGEVNAGVYLLSLDLAERLLPKVSNANRSGEYYITDLVGLALDEGCEVRGVMCGTTPELLGVNSPAELNEAEEILRATINRGLLASGVILHAVDGIRISPLARIEPGAEITGPCEITGKTIIHADARVMTSCVIRDSEVEGGAEIRPFSHLESAVVRAGALVGPYARLRPGAELCANSHVGNFVELKKTVLGEGAKANHLTYLGDARVGAGTNIGAGTITCNYDGKHKYQTVIGENAFIGSNTAMVAPVHVGSNTLVGAGSIITKDVPDGELAIARARQKNLGTRRPAGRED